MNKEIKWILIGHYYVPGRVWSRVKQERGLGCKNEGGAHSGNLNSHTPATGNLIYV